MELAEVSKIGMIEIVGNFLLIFDVSCALYFLKLTSILNVQNGFAEAYQVLPSAITKPLAHTLLSAFCIQENL